MKADIVVVGNGPTAWLAGLALGGLGLDVMAVAPAAARGPDPRTIALMPSSVEALARLGVDVRPHATALTGLVIETSGPFGLVSQRFTAADAGEAYLAQNLPVADLVDLMPPGRVIGSTLAALDFTPGRTTVVTAAGDRIAARLVVAADGLASPTREAAGIALRRRPLAARAWCAPAELERPHGRLCRERYDDEGTLTVIPVGERGASLISIAPDAADPARSQERLSRRQPAYGSIRVVGAAAVFPLSISWAPRPVARRVVAVGEAAHVAPPIGAQGWNMAVRDVVVLREVVAAAVAAGADIGGGEVLARYARQRGPDLAARISAVGALAGLAITPAGPLRLARQAGLLALSGMPGAKRRLMRAGLR